MFSCLIGAKFGLSQHSLYYYSYEGYRPLSECLYGQAWSRLREGGRASLLHFMLQNPEFAFLHLILLCARLSPVASSHPQRGQLREHARSVKIAASLHMSFTLFIHDEYVRQGG